MLKMVNTPDPFSAIRHLLETDLLGSVLLFGLFIILILVILVFASKVSMKIGLLLIFPALLALFGVGVEGGLIGGMNWIPVMIVIAVALGIFAFMWYRMTEG